MLDILVSNCWLRSRLFILRARPLVFSDCENISGNRSITVGRYRRHEEGRPPFPPAAQSHICVWSLSMMVLEIVDNLSSLWGLLRIKNAGLLHPTRWVSPSQQDALGPVPLFDTLPVPILPQCWLIDITPILIDYFGTLRVLYCTEVIKLGGGVSFNYSRMFWSAPFVLTAHPFLDKSGYVQQQFFFYFFLV